MPQFASLKQTIRRVRNILEDPSPNSKSLTDFDILGSYSLIENGNKFELYDFGRNNNRLIIFATSYKLGILDKCKIFSHMYTVHGLFDGYVISLVYCLLSDKSESVYTAVLAKMKESKPEINPENVLTDLVVINSTHKLFPSANTRMGSFYFSRCVYRTLGKFQLEAEYDTDVLFAQKIKCYLH